MIYSLTIFRKGEFWSGLRIYDYNISFLTETNLYTEPGLKKWYHLLLQRKDCFGCYIYGQQGIRMIFNSVCQSLVYMGITLIFPVGAERQLAFLTRSPPESEVGEPHFDKH